MERPQVPHKFSYRVDTSWNGLHLVEEGNRIYSPDIKPLSHNQIQKAIDRIVVSGKYRSGVFSEALRSANAEVLSQNQGLAVVLDGRAYSSSEGYLGDMIEASRVVQPLLDMGKKVTIITPHPDVFLGSEDIEILTIPQDIPGSPHYPWSQELGKFIHDRLGSTPIAFPLNAALPVFVQFDSASSIENTDTISRIQEAIHPNSNDPKITPNNWWKRGLHQLQALQTVMYLMGVEGVDRWEQFPEAFLFPSVEARQTAKDLVTKYDYFNGNDKTKRIPLFIHPGVATGGRKLISKQYPERRWKEVLDILYESNTIKSIVLLRPSNEQQAEMTERLVQYAIAKGFFTSLIPPRGEQSATQWSFGTFIAFLQELNNAHGFVVGVDSMPAGHAATAVGNKSVVLSSLDYHPGFYSPGTRARVILPTHGAYVSGIAPTQVTSAAFDLLEKARR